MSSIEKQIICRVLENTCSKQLLFEVPQFKLVLLLQQTKQVFQFLQTTLKTISKANCDYNINVLNANVFFKTSKVPPSFCTESKKTQVLGTLTCQLDPKMFAGSVKSRQITSSIYKRFHIKLPRARNSITPIPKIYQTTIKKKQASWLCPCGSSHNDYLDSRRCKKPCYLSMIIVLITVENGEITSNICMPSFMLICAVMQVL